MVSFLVFNENGFVALSKENVKVQGLLKYTGSKVNGIYSLDQLFQPENNRDVAYSLNQLVTQET